MFKFLMVQNPDRDFAHIDHFGRAGIWRLSEDVWVAVVSLLGHVSRKVAELTTNSGVGTDEPFEDSFHDSEMHLANFREMMVYDVEEQVRAGVRSSDVTADRLALVQCIQV